jgi:hypothetical protein
LLQYVYSIKQGEVGRQDWRDQKVAGNIAKGAKQPVPAKRLMRFPPVLPHPDRNGERDGKFDRPFHLLFDQSLHDLLQTATVKT